jgi:hypothetical protein
MTSPMSKKSAAVYASCGAILVACLAAANMPSQDADVVAPSPARAPRVQPEAIAADVQAQAERLHERMAEAPSPSAAVRNPFAFGEPRGLRRPPTVDPVHATATAEPAPTVAAAPTLLLMGIAEETTPSGPHRTAIIGGDGDAIFMVTEGESVAGRYKVTKIGADAIELEDQTTKGYRRLALR